jgi:predicted phosphodiesterase
MKTSNAQLARDYIQRFPRHGTRTLAKLMAKEHPARWTVESARDCVKKCSTKSGASNRYIQAQRTPTVAPPPAVPQSKAKAWTPVQLCDKAERVFVMSDIHVPYHDDLALACALNEAKAYKPTIIFINGDLCDFYAISRWETDPDIRNFKVEVLAIRQFLAALRKKFPKARIVLKLGNHEERFWTYIWRRCLELFGIDSISFPALIHADKYGVEVIGEKRIVLLGKLATLHGHELPKGLATPVNPARGAFLRALDSLMVGHLHRTSEHTETTLGGKIIT